MSNLYKSLTDDEVVVEARVVDKTSVSNIAGWCAGVEVIEIDPFNSSLTFAAVNVPTAGGMMRAQEDDYVVRLPTGDFYVHKPLRFKELFVDLT